MTFAEKLAVLRKRDGFSQESLAERLAVSRQAVSRWENGGAIPDAPTLLQISDLFGVSVDALLRDEMPCPGAASTAQAHPTVKGARILALFLQALGLIEYFIGYQVFHSEINLILSLVFYLASITLVEMYAAMSLPQRSDAADFRRSYYRAAVWLFMLPVCLSGADLILTLLLSGYSYLLLLPATALPYLLICGGVSYLLRSKKEN